MLQALRMRDFISRERPLGTLKTINFLCAAVRIQTSVTIESKKRLVGVKLREVEELVSFMILVAGMGSKVRLVVTELSSAGLLLSVQNRQYFCALWFRFTSFTEHGVLSSVYDKILQFALIREMARFPTLTTGRLATYLRTTSFEDILDRATGGTTNKAENLLEAALICQADYWTKPKIRLTLLSNTTHLRYTLGNFWAPIVL